MSDPRTIVVGGGLAGLTAAAHLVRHGHEVLVLESGEHLGGRARSRHRDDYDLNLGPHALYRTGGGLAAVLRGLGVPVKGRLPRVDRAGVFVDGAVEPALRHLRHGVRDRRRVLRALTGLGDRHAADWVGRSAQEWVDSVTDDEAGRALVASLVRTTTYAADLALLDAGAATRQLRRAAHGVVYLHHGWSSLVSGLADVVESSGGTICTRSMVVAVDHDDTVRGVRLADGRELTADAIVVALADPRQAARLFDGRPATALAAVADDGVPVRMAHLDVALRPLPRPRFPNVLGVDEPVFISVPSSVATVAPPGGAVLQSYPGVWLPEPIATTADPADEVERLETLTLGFLVLLERLTPIERAVFVLHDALDHPYPTIAAAVGRSEEACRQTLHRARRHVTMPQRRSAAEVAHAEGIAQQFVMAGFSGDTSGLLALLAPAITVTSDGGGVVHAAMRPVTGPQRVARFLTNLSTKVGADPVVIACRLNGEPGLLLRGGDGWVAVAVEVVDELVAKVWIVVNPAKLERLVDSFGEETAAWPGPADTPGRFRHRGGHAVS